MNATARSPLPLTPRALAAALLAGDRPLFALLRSVGTQALFLATSVLTGVLTARLLGPEGRGIYAAVTVWPALLATLATAGLGNAVVVRLRKAPEQAHGTTGAALVLAFATASLAVATGALVIPGFLRGYDAGTVLFAQVCLASVFVNVLQIVIKQTHAGLRDFGRCNRAHLLPQVFYLLALVAALPFVDSFSARTAVLALLGAGAVAVAVMLPAFVAAAAPRLRTLRADLPKLASFTGRAVTTDVVFTLSYYADRLLLLPFLGMAELGMYAVAFSLSRVVQLAQPAIMSVLLAHMSTQSLEDSRVLHAHAFRMLLVALLGLGGAMWLCGERLLGIAYGEVFAGATLLFQLLVIEASLGALSQVTVQFFLSRDRPGVVSTVQALVLMFTTALLAVLVPAHGALGAAIALCLGAALRELCLLAALKVVFGISPPRPVPLPRDLRYLRGRFR